VLNCRYITPVMYSDITGYLPTFIVTAIVGVFIGVITGGVNAYLNGDDILGGMINGALTGGAIGLAFGLGVVYLGPLLAGQATASVSSAAIAFFASTATSFAAGAVGYTIEESLNNRPVTFKNAIGHGSIVAIESMMMFGTGSVAGMVGKVGSLNFFSGEWVLKQVLVQTYTAPAKYLFNRVRDLYFD